MRKFLAICLSLFLIIAPVSSAQANGGGYAKQILGMSNGIIGAVILVKCPPGFSQPSLLLYMGGGITYILSELTTGKKKTADVQRQSMSLDQVKATMKEGGDYQKAAIEMQIADEKSNLDFVKKRRKWFMAIKTMYIAATAAAAIELMLRITGKPDIGGCVPEPVSHIPHVALISGAYAALSATGSIKGMAVGMATSAAVKFVLAKIGINLGIGTQIANLGVTALNLAEGRIAIFGASSLLASSIDSDLAKEENRIKGNLEQLEKVKAQFENTDNALAEGASGPSDGSKDGKDATIKTPSGQFALTALPKGDVKEVKTCFSQSKGTADYSPAACNTPMKITGAQFGPGFELPTLQTAANMTTDIAQSLANGDVEKAEIEAGNLSAMAGRLDKIKNDLVAKVNDQLKADGKKPIDFQGELDRQINELNTAMNKANGSNGSSMASTSTNTGAVVSETKVDPNESGKTSESTTTNTAILTEANGIDLSKIESDSVVEEIPAEEKVASLEESLNQYEQSQSDIAKDPGISIFKQVSNRYFLNYNKIFNRKEIAPPLAAPEASK